MNGQNSVQTVRLCWPRVFLAFFLAVMVLLLPGIAFSRGGGGHGGGHSGGSHGGSHLGSSSSGSHSGSSRGGHYIGGTGSSHKGSHYYHPATGNHYSRSAGSHRSTSSALRAPSVKHAKIHSSTSRITYDGSVRRDSHGRIERSESAKQQFVHSLGYKNVPKGYEVDHKIPLYAGGSDTPSNMQLLTKAQHHAKTKADYQSYGR